MRWLRRRFIWSGLVGIRRFRLLFVDTRQGLSRTLEVEGLGSLAWWYLLVVGNWRRLIEFAFWLGPRLVLLDNGVEVRQRLERTLLDDEDAW